jgi:hypothetical protein
MDDGSIETEALRAAFRTLREFLDRHRNRATPSSWIQLDELERDLSGICRMEGLT